MQPNAPCGVTRTKLKSELQSRVISRLLTTTHQSSPNTHIHICPTDWGSNVEQHHFLWHRCIERGVWTSCILNLWLCIHVSIHTINEWKVCRLTNNNSSSLWEQQTHIYYLHTRHWHLNAHFNQICIVYSAQCECSYVKDSKTHPGYPGHSHKAKCQELWLNGMETTFTTWSALWHPSACWRITDNQQDANLKTAANDLSFKQILLFFFYFIKHKPG